MLTFYLTQTRSLLQLPGSNSTSLYSDTDLTRWINIARGQVAGEGGCIRVHAPISTVVGQEVYNFSAFNVGIPTVTGIQGIIRVNSLSISINTGQLWMAPRPWPWFSLYNRNNPNPQQGQPTEWAQFGQGAAPGTAGGQAASNGGSLYLSPVPDAVYTVTANAICYPVPLVDDTTAEAIPFMWTDAVPFFAAYFGLMSAQTNARMADAAQMYKGHYNEFMDRARKQSNPNVNNWIYQDAGDPAQGAKFGMSKGGAQ